MIPRSEWVEIKPPCEKCPNLSYRHYQGTVIGDYLISTMGEAKVSDELKDIIENIVEQACEDLDEEYGEDATLSFGGWDLSSSLSDEESPFVKYMTIVVNCQGITLEGIPIIEDWLDVESNKYNHKEHAEQGHEAFCVKYAKLQRVSEKSKMSFGFSLRKNVSAELEIEGDDEDNIS